MINLTLRSLLLLGSLSVAAQPAGDLTLSDFRALTETFGHVQKYYVDETTDRELFEGAIRGMLSRLDEYTQYLTPAEYGNLTATTTAEYGGVGVELLWQADPIALRIIGVTRQSAAAAAGLRTDELIVAVDGQPLRPLLPAQAMSLIRGEVDTQVTLTVCDSNCAQPRQLTLTRELIHVETVAPTLLDENIAQLVVTSFASATADDAAYYLQQLAEQAGGSLNGLIIDLRGNVGGTVTSAVALADLVLDGGLIVYSQGRNIDAELRLEAEPGDVLAGAPIAVLVDRMSASASEILAGALKDNERAMIIGERTFGKGSIQTVLPLRNGGAIKLTTSRYFTPDGRAIHRQGITPDVATSPADGDRDAPMATALAWLRERSAQ